ncbi:hypothetical protein PGTUg99_033905 [Puccinia graminis f. sp. tritici]|uniref:Uncharacterized protein n=1 Tax=Puccinia graminis f. sp. tritici TaxID=56615 RepID=A0A5B0SMN5_PUCGR|nr:hypothetical protein PGTUg99_033905 [Puccinia graminis f. sp. tritici]
MPLHKTVACSGPQFRILFRLQLSRFPVSPSVVEATLIRMQLSQAALEKPYSPLASRGRIEEQTTKTPQGKILGEPTHLTERSHSFFGDSDLELSLAQAHRISRQRRLFFDNDRATGVKIPIYLSSSSFPKLHRAYVYHMSRFHHQQSPARDYNPHKEMTILKTHQQQQQNHKQQLAQPERNLKHLLQQTTPS